MNLDETINKIFEKYKDWWPYIEIITQIDKKYPNLLEVYITFQNTTKKFKKDDYRFFDNLNVEYDGYKYRDLELDISDGAFRVLIYIDAGE